ncbi:MAG: RNA polymerase sigma factor RpoH [Deltaproteobacteria bacterium]|uniref:RNA polymerase sigma factor n=1 Tax=Candidatus Zymogenus saltonus TaxID=2844893 RepID=A0A9D8PNG0_9DELT|nr:RNA polymerase sigma factor RpoH [Candidatus Zymogenus saltonus]
MNGLPATTNPQSIYMNEINRYPLLSREEEFDLAVRWKEHKDIDAAHKLVVSNLRFVVKIAHEYKDYGLKLMDLVQEGNIGLMQAVKKFDPYKGFRLISYAVWWIRAYIQNFIIKSWSLVKIGTTQAQKKLFYKMKGAKRALGIDITKEDDISAIAKELDVNDDVVREMDQRLSGRDLSLNSSIGDEDDETTYIDFISEEPAQESGLIEDEEKRMLAEDIKDALKVLNEKERYIVKHRIMSQKPKTLQEIADKYSVSRERIRQIEVGALKKLRNVPAMDNYAVK